MRKLRVRSVAAPEQKDCCAASRNGGEPVSGAEGNQATAAAQLQVSETVSKEVEQGGGVYHGWAGSAAVWTGGQGGAAANQHPLLRSSCGWSSLGRPTPTSGSGEFSLHREHSAEDGLFHLHNDFPLDEEPAAGAGGALYRCPHPLGPTDLPEAEVPPLHDGRAPCPNAMVEDPACPTCGSSCSVSGLEGSAGTLSHCACCRARAGHNQGWTIADAGVAARSSSTAGGGLSGAGDAATAAVAAAAATASRAGTTCVASSKGTRATTQEASHSMGARETSPMVLASEPYCGPRTACSRMVGCLMCKGAADPRPEPGLDPDLARLPHGSVLGCPVCGSRDADLPPGLDPALHSLPHGSVLECPACNNRDANPSPGLDPALHSLPHGHGPKLSLQPQAGSAADAAVHSTRMSPELSCAPHRPLRHAAFTFTAVARTPQCCSERPAQPTCAAGVQYGRDASPATLHAPVDVLACPPCPAQQVHGASMDPRHAAATLAAPWLAAEDAGSSARHSAATAGAERGQGATSASLGGDISRGGAGTGQGAGGVSAPLDEDATNPVTSARPGVEPRPGARGGIQGGSSRGASSRLEARFDAMLAEFVVKAKREQRLRQLYPPPLDIGW